MISVSAHKPDTAKPWLYSCGFLHIPIQRFEELPKFMVRRVGSGIVWKDGIRKETNFQFADYAVLDFDSPEMPIKEAINIFCDVNHIIATTKSHQKEKNGIICDRYRVIFPFSERITSLEIYRHNMRLFQQRYPCDKCIDGARYFFPSKEVMSIETESGSWDVNKNIPDKAKFKVYSQNYSKAGVLPKLARIALKDSIKHGERNIFFYKMARDMAQCGYSFEQIYKIIQRSPTYHKQWCELVAREITATINSAIKSLRNSDDQRSI
jgi:hypothetical protein